MSTGIVFGLIVGAWLWWSSYIPGEGLLQNLRLLLIPTAAGMTVVHFRNRWKKVGPYDPEIMEKNTRGRV